MPRVVVRRGSSTDVAARWLKRRSRHVVDSLIHHEVVLVLVASVSPEGVCVASRSLQLLLTRVLIAAGVAVRGALEVIVLHSHLVAAVRRDAVRLVHLGWRFLYDLCDGALARELVAGHDLLLPHG